MVEIGYKVFDSNWKCFGYQYQIGEIFEYDGELKLGESGFHYWASKIRCLNYLFDMPNSENHKIAKIVALGDIEDWEDYDSDYKYFDKEMKVTNKILILEEIDVERAVKRYNMGYHNYGMYNIGNRNSGKHNIGNDNNGIKNCGNENSGHFNVGDGNVGINNTGGYNEGNYNVGHHNVGNHNSGNSNLGSCNAGERNFGTENSGSYNYGNNNSGHYNIGDSNIGMFNITDFGGGFFNTESHLFCFNKPFDIKDIDKVRRGMAVLDRIIPYPAISYTKYEPEMTAQEYKEMIKNNVKENWHTLSKEEIDTIMSIPNFDSKIFEEIFGISLPQ